MSYANRERRKTDRALLRYARRLRDDGMIQITEYYTKERIIRILGPSGIVLEDFDCRFKPSPYWHGQSPIALVTLTPPLKLE